VTFICVLLCVALYAVRVLLCVALYAVRLLLCDVHLCSLQQSAHAKLTINVQLYTHTHTTV
jgi:hypothetical protein